MMDLILYNTLTKKKDKFIPIQEGKVGIYCCGPTVYNYAHIGNLRAYFFEDILKRVLLFNGYDVKHVINITDVGHLVSDADEGEDKMEKGSQREKKSVWETAEFFTQSFKEDISLLNILPPSIWCKATDNIKEQIELIICLEKKGYTYITSDGVYYDSSKFPDYGKLANLDIQGMEEGKRIKFSDEKRHKTDFALWKFSPKDIKRQMEWDSPWGKGFPGWHIECSAMSMKYLGENFDIHCGGIDHIPIHHTNEIAQAEACTGKKFVNYWLHCEFLIEEKSKMSKSAGEFLRLQTLIERGYFPLDYRYFLLMTHYRKKIKFSFEGLDSAKNGYENLVSKISEILTGEDGDKKNDIKKVNEFKNKFLCAINNDINAGEGLAVLQEVINDKELSSIDKIGLIYDFDNVLGLKLRDVKPSIKEFQIPKDIQELGDKRLKEKKNKNFTRADEIRQLIKEKGFEITDTKDGFVIKPLKK